MKRRFHFPAPLAPMGMARKLKRLLARMAVRRPARLAIRPGHLALRRGLVAAASLALAALAPARVMAQTFAAPMPNPFGLAKVGYNASVAFADIDSDGDLDAFNGTNLGQIFFFANLGSPSAPSFAAAVSSPFGLANVEEYVSPSFADLDGDGDLDAFIGQNDGNFFFYENTGSSNAPNFSAAVANPFGLADLGIFNTPDFADLDGDGDLDLLAGEKYGSLFYFQNVGTVGFPSFAASLPNPFGLADVGDFSSPSLADLDGDGDQDLFVGESYGAIFYFANVGTPDAPSFAAPVSETFGLLDVGYSSSPCFADIDGDGDLDAFIGNSDGNIFFFRNAEPAAWDGSSWGGVTPGPGTDVLILGGYDSQEQGGFDCSNLRVGQQGLLLIGTGGTIRVGGQ